MARWEWIQNASRVVDPAGNIDLRDVHMWIREGILVAIEPHTSRAPSSLKPDDEICLLDGRDHLVTPLFMDIHVHFREPGNDVAETLDSGRQAALRGGYGCVYTMANTNPVCDTPDAVERTHRSNVGGVDVVQVSALSKELRGRELVDLDAMAAAGAGAFSDDGTWLHDRRLAEQAFRWSAKNDVLVMQHCEDFSITGPGLLHECSCTASAGVPGIDRRAEDKAVAADIAAAEKVASRLHVCHVSTEGAVKAIRSARAKGIPVTGEVTPHHLLLTAEDAVAGGVDFKMKPPLRESSDVDALIDALEDGTLGAIATDHAPHSDASKAGGWAKAPFGAIGLETAFSSIYTGLVVPGRLSLSRLVSALTSGPASIVGRDAPRLALGAPARLNLIDLSGHQAVDRDQLASKSKNCPFHGLRLLGWPSASFLQSRWHAHGSSNDERIRTRTLARRSISENLRPSNWS